MGRKSKLSRLPPEVKAFIEAELASGKRTLDELIAALQKHFPGTELPSRSGLGRYGQKLDRRLESIKASTEAAKIIRAHAGDSEDARSEALLAMVQTEIFDALINLQELDDDGMDAGDRVALLSKAGKDIATLTGSSIRLKKFQTEVMDRAKAAAESVDKIASKGGLTAEVAAQLRREILGIAA